MTRVAVGPPKTPEWIRDAVRAAGCELADYADADALVWGDPRGADALGAVMRAHQHFRWVQLPFAGIENFVPHLDTERVGSARVTPHQRISGGVVGKFAPCGGNGVANPLGCLRRADGDQRH
ncbi:MAG: hypothetical protein ACKOJH_10365 [Actinomycetota bacterium]